jgi:AcrR family transcriptional regulator
MARTSEITDIALLDRLTDVFRRHGYEGASLTRISEATGLQRASLYHRFPGGKSEMAEAVLARADEWLIENALGPLQGPGAPGERIRTMAVALDEFYGEGRHSCLLDAFSLGGENEDIREHVRASMTAWIAALAVVVEEVGVASEEAHDRAQDAVARIQGALVVSRATGEARSFQRTLQNLPTALLGTEDPRGR